MAHVAPHNCWLQLSDFEHCSAPNRFRALLCSNRAWLPWLAGMADARRAISSGTTAIARVFLEHTMNL
jgi:hypothetical protein